MLQAYHTSRRKQIISLKILLKNNNGTNKQEQNISSKKEPPGHSAWKGLKSKTVTKNPIFHN